MNFKRYVESSDTWVDTPHYIHNTSTDTLTTLPADIYANDTTATVGLKGNMSQSGTPSPSSPIYPQETGDKTANLFSEPLVDEYTLDGTTGLPKPYPDRCSILNPIDVGGLQNVTITFTATLERTRIIYSLFNNTTLIRRVTAVASGTTIDVSEGNNLYISFYDANITGSVSGDDISNTMLNSGSTPLPYQPYGQYKIPISSAGQTTPVYLGEVQTTRRIKKLVLTGTENWIKNDAGNPSNYLYYQTGYLANKTCVCSHLADMGTLSPSKVGVINGNNVLYLNFGSAIMNAQPSGNTVEGLKEYLAQQYAAGTPVCVWYVLAEPATGIVNEPLRKIGTYADEVSGITIPTIAGENAVDVLTTLKPSEVTATYKGWHPVADVHERESGAWT